MQDIGRPGVEQSAVDLIPGPAFPCAEIDFEQSPIEAWSSLQGLGEAARAPRGTGDHRCAGGQQPTQALGEGLRVDRLDIELTITNAGRQQRAGVPDQEKLHSSPQ